MLSNLKTAFWYIAIAFFFSNVTAQIVFVYTRPRKIVPSLGREYPLNVHGTTVYLTFFEHLVAGFPTLALAVVFGAAWALLSNYQEKNRPEI